MRRGRALAAAVGVLALGPVTLTAQQGPELVARGIRAYNDVDADAATGFLRRWFASAEASGATLEDRRQALVYLGAAEVLRDNGDSGSAAFERVVKLDPRYRIDELLFAPEVTTLFGAVRQRTKAVAVQVPPLTTLGADGAYYTARLFASSTHFIQVQVRRPDGPVARVVYDGPIGDSLDLRWDGRDSTGSTVPSGSYYVEVRSGAFRNLATRVLQLPLEITTQRTDTLAHPAPPPDSLRLPERRASGPGVEALAGGVLAGLAAAVLPMLLAPDANLEAARYAVAALAGGAGILGFAREFPGSMIAGNRLANEQRDQGWQELVAVVAAENRTRRAAARMVLHTGEPIVADLTGR
ncbi:MAG TPA: hypothetical protein VF970_11585 [Gemmatimonadales bacterium]